MNACEMCGPTEAEVNSHGICEDCHIDREAQDRGDMESMDSVPHFNEETDFFEN